MVEASKAYHNADGAALEVRGCFNAEAHQPHEWHSMFWCEGRGLDKDGYLKEPRLMKYWAGEMIPVRSCGEMTHHEEHSFGWISDDQRIGEQSYCAGVTFEDYSKMLEALSPELSDGTIKTLTETRFDPPIEFKDETAPAPGILDGRVAYGDRVQNMKEQAAMINAYLGTPPRAIEAVDVPIIFVLIKAHRLGKMPDYADSYNDIDGYMQIAREVIGDDMIDAATAKEYAEEKKRRQLSGIVIAPRRSGKASAIKEHLKNLGVDVETVTIADKPRHPYENVERDAEADAMRAHDEARAVPSCHMPWCKLPAAHRGAHVA